MKTPAFNTTLLFYPNKNPKLRLVALWYFTTLMVVWNILGHTYLGFEQSHAEVVVSIVTAIFMQLFLEWLDAVTNNRLKFLTNNFVVPALTIAQIYKCRWQVELFFES